MAYGIGDTLFDSCEDIKQRLADEVTPEEAAPYFKLITLMEALGGYGDQPRLDQSRSSAMDRRSRPPDRDV